MSGDRVMMMLSKKKAMASQERLDLMCYSGDEGGELRTLFKFISKLGLNNVTETKFSDPVQGHVV